MAVTKAPSWCEALISDYLNEGESDDENNHRNKGKIITITINTRNHSKMHINVL